MPPQLAFIAALFALPLSPAGAAAPYDEGQSSCAESLEASLQGLVGLPESTWRFVILEEPASGSFIQFGWWGSVVVDLPIVALNLEQQALAARVFEKLGSANPLIDPGPPDAEAEPMQVLRHDFGRDTAAASRFGCNALRSIYKIAEDLPLEITTGGD